jgi:hypothetical protein
MPRQVRTRQAANTKRKRRGRKPRSASNPKPTPTSQALVAKRAEMAERRKRVLDLYVNQRLTMIQIAKIVGVSNATVAYDIWESIDELKDETRETVERWRAMLIARLDQADRAILPALYGQVQGQIVTKKVRGKTVQVMMPIDPVDAEYLKLTAHRQLLKSIEMVARLKGSFAPVKIAPTTPDGTRPYRDLSDEELEAKIRERESELKIVVGQVVASVPAAQEEREGDGG